MSKLLVLLALLGCSSATYKHKIDPFSFDTQYEEYPLAYNTFGAAVGLVTKMKLVPAATPASGAIFLNQVIICYCN